MSIQFFCDDSRCARLCFSVSLKDVLKMLLHRDNDFSVQLSHKNDGIDKF